MRNGAMGGVILVTVRSGALAGAMFTLVWIEAPPRDRDPELVDQLRIAAVLLALGGILYGTGVVTYTRSVGPVPAASGYHKLFHLLVIAAAAVQYDAVCSLRHVANSRVRIEAPESAGGMRR